MITYKIFRNISSVLVFVCNRITAQHKLALPKRCDYIHSIPMNSEITTECNTQLLYRV